MRQRHLAFLILCITTFCHSTIFAEVRLPALLTDNMVLQRNATVKLWGWSGPNEKVVITTSWNNRTDSIIANGDAKWSLNIQTPGAGGPYSITFRGENTIVLNNVMLGEVWVCSGQSNMEWGGFKGLKEIEEALPASANKNLRFFHVPKTTADYPQDDCSASWQESGPATLNNFSAVAYFFGKQLSETLNVPVGLIHSSWGGTPAEAWTPQADVTGNEVLHKAALKIRESTWWPTKPGKAYNAMIAPLLPFTIAGAIWYQGESNTETSDTYQQLLTTMISRWREEWNKEFPFYYVQIAPYTYEKENIGALLREAQANVQAHPKTGMVVVTDLVENVKDIHPQQKRAVGQRLANFALAETYGKTGIAYRSPVFRSMSTNKNKTTLTFDHAPNGFLLKGNKATEWYIAGPDKQFYPADVTINNNKIIVSSPRVTAPVAIRFGFSNEAMPNLFSKEGLPVTPFRTDDWDVSTQNK
ncbi:MAG: sialate O-acetylesterase [Chitinophagaceae bacterium]|nr:MAG: sialate O-acetylesterase [Chitinophagaceae bacterium]